MFSLSLAKKKLQERYDMLGEKRRPKIL